MWDITLIFLVICSAWSQVCCILLQTLVNTSDKHSWKKQHVLYHTKETHYISFNNRIENNRTEMWMLPRRQLCIQEYLQHGNICPWCSPSMASEPACVCAHFFFSLLLEKWIMAGDYEYGKSTNSLRMEPLAQPASAGSTVEITGPWNHFSLVRLNQTPPTSSHTPIVKLCCVAELHLFNSNFFPTSSDFTSSQSGTGFAKRLHFNHKQPKWSLIQDVWQLSCMGPH